MELREALSKLDEQESIADFLKEQKITGNREDATSCVISNYLYEATSQRYVVTTSYIAKERSPGISFGSDIILGDEIPKKVKTLIDEFDHGNHPELVAPHVLVADGSDPAPQDGA